MARARSRMRKRHPDSGRPAWQRPASAPRGGLRQRRVARSADAQRQRLDHRGASARQRSVPAQDEEPALSQPGQRAVRGRVVARGQRLPARRGEPRRRVRRRGQRRRHRRAGGRGRRAHAPADQQRRLRQPVDRAAAAAGRRQARRARRARRNPPSRRLAAVAPRALGRQLRLGQRSAPARGAGAVGAGGAGGARRVARRQDRGLHVGADRALHHAGAGTGEVRRLAMALIATLVAAGACTQEPAGPVERPVALPDLSRVEPSVRNQGQQLFDALQAMRNKPGVPAADKGEAYGKLAMLLHAGEYYEAAEPAYLNAQSLTPSDARWPYLLGHLHKSRGEPEKALADFTRALELKPDDVPTLIWLGRLYLDHGEPAKAQPLFEKAQTLRPDVVAGIVGLGQAALAQKDYSRAATVLEEALRVHPTASSVHSPLAMAYRGLGDTAKAEEHLKQWKNTEVLVPDPVRQQLDLSLQSGLSFELRGVRALEARDYKAAEGFFRKGIPLAPGDTMLGRSLRHKLATALALQGDVSGAFDAFKEVVALAPQEGPDETAAKARYGLGVLLASAGRGREAITHLQAAVKFNPNCLEAREGLGDALSRAGHAEAALAQYAE